MAFSGTSTFEKFLSIDDIITESFERLGFFDYSGNDLRSARRSLNIMFQEWGNRGVHLWKVKLAKIPLVEGQAEYNFASDSDIMLQSPLMLTDKLHLLIHHCCSYNHQHF